MEQNQDDPGQRAEVIPHTAPQSTKDVQATLILEKFAEVFCATLQSDQRLTGTEELLVPETGAIPVQAPKRRWQRKSAHVASPTMTKKRCWQIGGQLFDAKADTPQMLFVASDGTPYFSFAKLGRNDSYVEVTKELLLKQSGSMLSHILAELSDALEALPKRPRDKSA